MDATLILGTSTEGDMVRAPIRLRDLEDGTYALSADPDLLQLMAEQNALMTQQNALLTQIRDDQRAAQGETISGRVVKTKSITASLNL